jgi:curved DNA-binding protein CbpA
MDPYDILGLPENATREEIKKAYRREAMKWHPDRCKSSSEAQQRFHQAAEAYRFLSENYSPGGDDDSAKQSSTESQHRSSDSAQADSHSHSRYSRDQSGDEFADTVFWEVMLDFAIKLAQTGLSESEISNKLAQNGCQQKLASIIAGKAFNIHAHYAASSGRKRKQGTDKSTFKEERLEAELQRAFIGRRNFFLSPRDTIEYYLVVFSEFRQTMGSNPLSMINTNKRLMRILKFSMLLFAVIILTLNFFPGESQYKLLPDETLLQLPLGILALMFIWTTYRKLWLLTVCFWFIYLATLAIFDVYAPQALDEGYLSILPFAIICYAPFIFIALFGNYFYYRKAQKVIQSANHLFRNHQEKIIWIMNNEGTSSTAVFIFVPILLASMLYLEPEQAEFLDSIDFSFPDFDPVENEAVNHTAKLRLKQAGEFFAIAESHFNSSPPDYLKASMAYSSAADNGSLLAAYKLGYMHYVGAGVEQSDLLALDYFELATRTPLAFQPHSLQLTTEFLAESYNNLGIMYQSGYGAKRNTKKALAMYRKAAEFGSKSAQRNLRTIHTRNTNSERRPLASPAYR